jgi:hypothetical protein
MIRFENDRNVNKQLYIIGDIGQMRCRSELVGSVYNPKYSANGVLRINIINTGDM